MLSFQVSLPNNLQEFVISQVNERGLSTPSEYMGELVRAEQLRKAKAEIEAEIIKGLESGPSEPMTQQDWDDLRARARGKINR